MDFNKVLENLKGLIPILKPIGEQGINQLFDMLDEMAKDMGGDWKDVVPIVMKALREIALVEFRKL